jgi:hypothetical protein
MKKRQTNKLISKEKLVELYFDKGYSITMIENELDVARSRIEKLFTQYGITKKTMSEIQLSPLVRKKIEHTCIEKYGVKAAFADVVKRNKTKKELYGNENYTNIEKAKKTNLMRYGHTSYLATEECKNIVLKKYGVSDNIFQSHEIKEKSKQTKKELYGNENYNNIEKAKKTWLNLYGFENPSQSEIIKNKKIQTSLKKYGVEYPWQLDIIKNKVERVMLKKYGVKNSLLIETSIKRAKEKMIELYGCEHGFQSQEIQKKAFKNSYRLKEYEFKSGKKVYVMGYENYMLDILVNKDNIKEDDILTNYDCPVIKWFSDDGKQHKHIPDIFIKSKNMIIEVKSEYTAQTKNLKNILLKKKYAEMEGYEYKIYVINKKTKKIEYEIN